MTFGSRIAKARGKAGLTMQEVAAETGISKSLLRFWELGEVASPDLGKIMRLASVLGLDPLELAGFVGYEIADALPPLQPYLRSKYPDLPATAQSEIAAIVSKHGIDPARSGPAPGQDES